MPTLYPTVDAAGVHRLIMFSGLYPIRLALRDTAHDTPTHGDWVGWIGEYADIAAGREGQYRLRIMDNTHGGDCAYPAIEVLPDGTIFTATYGHWTRGEEPYIAGVHFTLDQIDAIARNQT